MQMYKSSFKYVFVVFLISTSAQKFYAQEIVLPDGSPEWLIQMFFKSENFSDKANYFSGEMLNDVNEQTIGEELNEKGEVYFYLFSSDEVQKAFAINLKINSTDLDFYCYLVNSTEGWKIEAVRRFLFPGFIYAVADSLSNLSSLSESDSSTLELLKLMTSTDEYLKNYLKIRIEKFERLLQSFDENNAELIEAAINELSLYGIFKDDVYPGCVFIQIAGIESREVGYIYKPENSALPVVSPRKFIYIGEVLPGWYLYRLI